MALSRNYPSRSSGRHYTRVTFGLTPGTRLEVLRSHGLAVSVRNAESLESHHATSARSRVGTGDRRVARLAALQTASQAPAFDLVIRGGRVVDGTGNPWFLADVGVKGDSIAAVAPHLDSAGARIVEAQGLVVSPGFIDVHSHADAGTNLEPLGTVDPLSGMIARTSSGIPRPRTTCARE